MQHMKRKEWHCLRMSSGSDSSPKAVAKKYEKLLEKYELRD